MTGSATIFGALFQAPPAFCPDGSSAHPPMSMTAVRTTAKKDLWLFCMDPEVYMV